MTNALIVIVAIESAIYHGIGIYRHYHWIRKQRAKR